MAAGERVIPLTVVASANGADQEQALYEVRRKIYPRAVGGWFARWRWATVFATQLVFYGTPWLAWNDRQGVLFDLAARKFYVFGLVLWPQDFIYLTVLLLISAFSLFLFTAVAGRLWCGYACPQTVYTEIFLWIERKIEGEHLAQKKLDSGPLDARKFRLKAAKHGVWIALSLWTGFTFVGYFTPIRELVGQVLSFTVGPWETFWILFYGFATYGNAGWLREQVCKYMCPYARFQGVMFDRDTLLITYDETRGEPRGSRSKKADYKAQGLGDCVDCGICVQVCPTGIDIREGQQYECIGCAACIDGCDQVMDKMGYPPGLIRYSTLNAVEKHLRWNDMVRRVLRPRVLVYTAILWIIIGAALASIFLRVPLKVDVIRDRASLAREVEDERVENVYRLQIMNTEEKSHRFVINAWGMKDIRVITDTQPLEIGPASSRVIAVRLQVKREDGRKGINRIEFIIDASDDEDHLLPELFDIHEKSVFFIP